MKQVVWSTLSESARVAALQRPAAQSDTGISESVRSIVSDVRARGDAALKDYTKKFDGVDLKTLSVPYQEIENAEQAIGGPAASAIRRAYQTIYKFHQPQGFQPYDRETLSGVSCARAVRPIERIGLYVPGGSAPLISTTLMIGVPSQIAGCPERILCTPCDQKGDINPHILYAAKLCCIQRVYKLGGAQAIAAMAYGTETIPTADKIFGPGNAYVTATKQSVAEDPSGAALDMPAGPSEVCVIADESTNPILAAADLLSQAEHDTMSQVLLIAPSESKAQEIRDEVVKQIETLPRKDIAGQAMQNSLVVVVDGMSQALEVSNFYAPEHLILCFEGADKYVEAVHNAGSIFVGPWTTESAGDYCSGTNHVLPTYGYARCYSGLSVEAFQKTITVQALTEHGLKNLGDTIETLARLEGLEAHARAVSLRINS